MPSSAKRVLDYTMAQVTPRTARGVAIAALERGATLASPWVVKARKVRTCSDPRTVTVAGRPGGEMRRVWKHGNEYSASSPLWWKTQNVTQKHVTIAPGTEQPIWVDMEVRCRKCPGCLRERQREWTARMVQETEWSSRTWMITLTMSAHSHYMTLTNELARMAARKIPADEIDEFKARAAGFGREITLWLKRVRKETGAPLSYCSVFEKHESGLPHAHLLLHEHSLAQPAQPLALQHPL